MKMQFPYQNTMQKIQQVYACRGTHLLYIYIYKVHLLFGITIDFTIRHVIGWLPILIAYGEDGPCRKPWYSSQNILMVQIKQWEYMYLPTIEVISKHYLLSLITSYCAVPTNTSALIYINSHMYFIINFCVLQSLGCETL